MKKRIAVFVVFFGSVIVSVALCLALNARTPQLCSGDVLPEAPRQYRLAYSAGDDGVMQCVFYARGQTGPLTLTVCDAEPFSLYFNGEKLTTYSDESIYGRKKLIPLGVPREGENTILFVPEATVSRDGKLLMGRLAVMKLLIGAETAAERVSSMYDHIEAMMIGAYMMLIFCSLVLFFKRRQEEYLFAVFVVALTAFLVLAIEQYAELLHISYHTFSSVRSTLFICPAVFISAISFHLLDDELSRRIRKKLTIGRLAVGTAVIMAVQYASSYNYNYALRVVMMALILATHCGAAARSTPGVYLLACGYGLSEGMRLVVFAVNTLGIASSGELLINLRVTQVGYLFFLILCMALVLRKFAGKFNQAEALIGTLDKKVEERTAQLRNANIALQDARQREHAVMTNVLHDLRTPIFHLQGYLDMLEEEHPGELTEKMRERLGYLRQMAENLFLAARLEEQRIAFHLYAFDAGELCRYAADAFRPAMEKKSQTLETDIPDHMALISDGFRVRQIVENLIQNATRYTAPGGWIKLEARAETQGVRIRIANSGAISPEDLPRIFDRFFHTGRSASSGLGLYISKALAEQLHGSLTADSRDGVTTLCLWIPQARGDTEEGDCETRTDH